jgi:hypothetical protein
MPLAADGTNRRSHLFPRSRFHYDAQHDYYRCPQGEILYYTHTRQDLRLYRTHANVCKRCPLRTQCTTSLRGRAVTHSIHKPVLDTVARYQQTAAYQKAMRKRQVWIEPKFAEIKLWHHARRFRLRRIHNVNIEALLKASGQNIKQLMKRWSGLVPLLPAKVALLSLSPLFKLFTSPFAISVSLISKWVVFYSHLFQHSGPLCLLKYCIIID